jgi:small neutral amino acid transporter SnatA (MarC family)
MLLESIMALILIVPIIGLVYLIIRTYKGLPNKEEKNKITYSLIIGVVISVVCVMVGLRTPTTEFGRFMSGQDFGKCVFAPK